MAMGAEVLSQYSRGFDADALWLARCGWLPLPLATTDTEHNGHNFG